MPKSKTHSGASKRFRRTGTGKIVRQKANRRHLLEHKPTKRTRRLDGRTVLAGNDAKRVKSCSTADNGRTTDTDFSTTTIGTPHGTREEGSQRP